jgi:hypothetical protein
MMQVDAVEDREFSIFNASAIVTELKASVGDPSPSPTGMHAG